MNERGIMEVKMVITREELTKRLSEGSVNVTFIKKSGESRTMKATLQDGKVPEVSQSRNTPEDLMVVYDLENSGWRSFYLSSVTEVA